MKFLANENVPIASVKYLKSKGFDITSIGVDDLGTSDEHITANLFSNMDSNRELVSFLLDNNQLSHLKRVRLLTDWLLNPT